MEAGVEGISTEKEAGLCPAGPWGHGKYTGLYSEMGASEGFEARCERILPLSSQEC
jgi:hypothetical protein